MRLQTTLFNMKQKLRNKNRIVSSPWCSKQLTINYPIYLLLAPFHIKYNHIIITKITLILYIYSIIQHSLCPICLHFKIILTLFSYIHLLSKINISNKTVNFTELVEGVLYIFKYKRYNYIYILNKETYIFSTVNLPSYHTKEM